MIGVGLFVFATADRGENLNEHMYLGKDSRGIPDVGYRTERDGGIVLATLTMGLCCPTVPYVIVMFILGTAYLAARSHERGEDYRHT